MNHKLLIAGLLTVAFVSSANLQAQGSAASSAARDPSSMVGSGGTGGNFNQMLSQQKGSMHFMGKVVVVEGSLPWDPIPVVVKCDGKTRYNAVTDTKGAFDIQPAARESEVVANRNDPKRPTPAALVGCKVSAVLDGFESSTITLANRTLEDDPNVGTITLRQDARATGSIVSPTSLSAPTDARKEADKARSDEVDGSLGSAKKHLQKAVSLYPQYAEAWYQLGKLEEKDKPQDALAAFKKAAALDPKFIPPYDHIAALAAAQQKWQDVADAANHALQLNPEGTPQIWYWSAVGNFNIGDKELAETAALTALSMDPGHVAAPKTEDELAVIQAARGKYKEALEHVRNALTYTTGPDADLMQQQVAQLEKIVAKTAK
ncbi:MAG: tetratricopeptide repeat protein [Terracidiphilus sp.]|jgi:tetratricopeptide (TPR) repeat protein